MNAAGNYPIILYGGLIRNYWIRLWARWGFGVMVCRDVQVMLGKVNRRWCTAVFLIRGDERWDVLDTVLNIRDVDAQVPILVLGQSEDGRIEKVLDEQGNVYRFHYKKSLERWAISKSATKSPQDVLMRLRRATLATQSIRAPRGPDPIGQQAH